MAGLLLKGATAALLLALALQYTGILRLDVVPGRSGRSSGGSGSSGASKSTVNSAKLLADLNADLKPATATETALRRATDSSTGAASSSPGITAATGLGTGTGTSEGSDGLLSEGGDGESMQRALSAAISLVYLAALPDLSAQVKKEPALLAALLRHAFHPLPLPADLAPPPEPQSPNPAFLLRHQRAQQRAELLAGSLLALARLVDGDGDLAAALLGTAGSREGWVAGGESQRSGAEAGHYDSVRLAEWQLLSRAEELLRSGFPAWQAATCVLLHSLAGAAAGDGGRGAAAGVVPGWVAAREEELVKLGVQLLETGAHYNITDVALSGSQLLQLVAAGLQGRRRLAASRAPEVAVQVLVTRAGDNTTAGGMLVGGAARLLTRLAVADRPAGRRGPSVAVQHREALDQDPDEETAGEVQEEDEEGEAARQEAGEFASDLALRKGLVGPLVREIRLGQKASLGPSLELLMGLVRAPTTPSSSSSSSSDRASGEESAGAGRPAGRQGAPPVGVQGEEDAVAAAAVGSGLLSLCSQLLFEEGREDDNPRVYCSAFVQHLLDRTLVSAAGRDGDQEKGEDEGELQLPGQQLGGAEGPGPSGVSGRSRDRAGWSGGTAYPATVSGRAALAGDLLRIMGTTALPDLHSAVVEAFRDVAPARPAAEALVTAGAVRHLAAVLAHNITAEYERGTDSSELSWLLHSQRSAAAVVALLALQRPLRPRVAAEGALVGLAGALAGREPGGQQGGLGAQVRVTAAAALVPLLGTDGKYDKAAVAAGVLEPLVRMYFRGGGHEQQAAVRVMRLLGRDPGVAALYERVGIQL